MRAHLLAAFLVCTTGCAAAAPPSSEPSSSAPVVVPPTETSAPLALVATVEKPAPAPDAPPSTPPVPKSVSPLTSYPIGAQCSAPDAITAENKKLAEPAKWTTRKSKRAALSYRVPPGVFAVREIANGVTLVSSIQARTLGENGGMRPFSITLRRYAHSLEDLLADTSKTSLLRRETDPGFAFPNGTLASFQPNLEDDFVAGISVQAVVAEKPAYIWVTGIEGYDTDFALVALGAKDALLLQADWNTSVMGQPECYQRAIIAGVFNSIKLD